MAGTPVRPCALTRIRARTGTQSDNITISVRVERVIVAFCAARGTDRTQITQLAYCYSVDLWAAINYYLTRFHLASGARPSVPTAAPTKRALLLRRMCRTSAAACNDLWEFTRRVRAGMCMLAYADRADDGLGRTTVTDIILRDPAAATHDEPDRTRTARRLRDRPARTI